MEGYLPEETCRTCLQKSEELTSLLLKDVETGLTLLEKLCLCASMQVVMSERTPSSACSRCVRCIVEYYNFKRRCELSEKTLEVLCSDPLAYTDIKVEVDSDREEASDSTVVDETEFDDNNLFCDDDSNGTPFIDKEQDVEESKHQCDMCSSSFTAVESLQKHKQLCHSVNKYSCDQCDASFPALTRLRLHLETHKEDAKHICEMCGKSYSVDTSLRIHIKENHAAKPKVYKCKVCGKTYNFISSLNSHKRTHFPDDPSCTCDQCGRSFQNRHRLRQHVRGIHEKQHACDICNKRFYYKPDLLKHKAHHANNMAKPYGCKLCPKRFMKKSAVAFHESTQHRDKKHIKCDVCGMKFYNRYHYKSHYSGHTGVKPFRCQGCGMGYTYNSSLLRHKEKCASLLALAKQ